MNLIQSLTTHGPLCPLPHPTSATTPSAFWLLPSYPICSPCLYLSLIFIFKENLLVGFRATESSLCSDKSHSQHRHLAEGTHGETAPSPNRTPSILAPGCLSLLLSSMPLLDSLQTPVCLPNKPGSLASLCTQSPVFTYKLKFTVGVVWGRVGREGLCERAQERNTDVNVRLNSHKSIMLAFHSTLGSTQGVTSR